MGEGFIPREYSGLALPTKVGESLVRVGDTMGVELFLDGVTDFSVGGDDFGGGFGEASTVFAAACISFFNTGAVEFATDNVVFNTRKVTDAAASDHDDTMFGQVMALTHDIGGDLLFV